MMEKRGDGGEPVRVGRLFGFHEACLSGFLVAVVAVSYADATRQNVESIAAQRLELVWPSPLRLPAEDRKFLAALAISCGLDRRPAQASHVIACLEQAASRPDTVLPDGMSHADAPDRLSHLVSGQVRTGKCDDFQRATYD
ncbi:hypothetical protein [Paraburkholderia youngii]|uniref:hypothetical protein n=1 Tax=Paraburkholderia youngii TaxID=2782701 RepID=UPI003D1D2D4B